MVSKTDLLIFPTELVHLQVPVPGKTPGDIYIALFSISLTSNVSARSVVSKIYPPITSHDLHCYHYLDGVYYHQYFPHTYWSLSFHSGSSCFLPPSHMLCQVYSQQSVCPANLVWSQPVLSQSTSIKKKAHLSNFIWDIEKGQCLYFKSFPLWGCRKVYSGFKFQNLLIYKSGTLW